MTATVKYDERRVEHLTASLVEEGESSVFDSTACGSVTDAKYSAYRSLMASRNTLEEVREEHQLALSAGQVIGQVIGQDAGAPPAATDAWVGWKPGDLVDEHENRLRFTTLDDQIIRTFVKARGVEFEDGMESAFSRTLVAIVEEHGDAALRGLAKLIVARVLDAEVVSESLRWLGDMDDASTHNERRRLLEKCLASPSYLIRDGAICGLSSLGEANVDVIRSAIDDEPFPQLRDDLQQLLEDVEH